MQKDIWKVMLNLPGRPPMSREVHLLTSGSPGPPQSRGVSRTLNPDLLPLTHLLTAGSHDQTTKPPTHHITLGESGEVAPTRGSFV